MKKGQKPTYFIGKYMQGLEIRYQKIENIALVLVMASRRLKKYFLANTIIVRTD